MCVPVFNNTLAVSVVMNVLRLFYSTQIKFSVLVFNLLNRYVHVPVHHLGRSGRSLLLTIIITMIMISAVVYF